MIGCTAGAALQDVLVLECNARGTYLSIQLDQAAKAVLSLAEVQAYDGPAPP